MGLRRVGLTALPIAALFAVTAGISTPASAAVPQGCPDNTVCLWQDIDFLGSQVSIGVNELPATPAVGLYDNGWDDWTSSAYNNTNFRVCMHLDRDLQGNWIVFDPHTQIENFGELNDTISSVGFC
jgi:hypothetical protein